MYKSIEELTLNSWPAEQTLLLQGWLVRYASGFTKRSNSVSPLYDCAGRDTEALVRTCETYYNERGLDSVFKLTPYTSPGNLDTILEERGYAYADKSGVRRIDLERAALPRLIATVSEEWSDDWLAGMSACNRLRPGQIETCRRIMRSQTLRHAYFTLHDGGTPVAYGLGVIQHGYIGLYDIVTDESCRRRGYGEQLVLNILHWGKQNGATHSYLQVVESNSAAVRLYDKIGYKPLYSYWYRVKKYDPGQDVSFVF